MSTGEGEGEGDLPDVGLEWHVADAQELPFEDNSFDAYTIAFGIRNVPDVALAVREARRVLRPGGRFLCLEFSEVTSPLLRTVYDQYSFGVIPELGAAIAGDRESYQYLVESIRQFPKQAEFRDLIADAGLEGATYENFTFGTVAVHSAFKLPA